MSENSSQPALSDEEILAIADAHLGRGLSERGGTMSLKTYFARTERALIGHGVIRRDLPFLSGTKKFLDEPEHVESATDKTPNRRSPTTPRRRVNVKMKMEPRLNPQWFIIVMAGYDEAKRDEFVEVHYEKDDDSAVVIIRNNQVVTTYCLSVPSPPPL